MEITPVISCQNLVDSHKRLFVLNKSISYLKLDFKLESKIINRYKLFIH